jgi:FtsP/CotA-like multicopper oxidase with cupredoxin domain
MDRRAFLGLAASAGVGGALPRGLEPWAAALAPQSFRHALPRIPMVAPDGLKLTARAATVNVGLGDVDAWTLNGSVPSPTIRARRGETARIQLVNRLPEETILHWHGLAVPYEADGHPRWAIHPGRTFDYEFRVLNRAGTYWYHPHTHMRTAAQTYQGVGGLFIVDDEEEGSYELPRGDYEIPLIVQDKRLAGGLSLAYELGMGPDMMMGYLGDTAFANGVANPTVGVRRARYRLRILNACNARILELGLSSGGAMTLIGGDGGLLGAPVAVDRVMLGPAERADVVVDFSGHAAGGARHAPLARLPDPRDDDGDGDGQSRRGRRSRDGPRARDDGAAAGGLPQGTEMDLRRVRRAGGPEPRDAPPLPTRFSEVPSRGDITADTPRRTFRFNSMMMSHTINGLTFDMQRVDARVRRNQTERCGRS